MIGIEQELYQTSEDIGYVEVCVAILEPSDLSLLRTSYVANLTLSLNDETAQGIPYTTAMNSIDSYIYPLLTT